MKILPRLLASLLLSATLAACDSGTGSGGGKPAHLSAASGDAQAATAGQPLPAPLIVRVTDSHDHAVAGAAVRFQVISGGGSVAPASTTTDAQGSARATWTLGTSTAAPQQVLATVLNASGAAVAADTFTATAQAGAPAAIASASAAPIHGPAGAALADSVAVLVRDEFGNPVPGATVVWTAQSGGGSVAPATSHTGANGIARAAWTLGATLGLQTLRAAAGLTLFTDITATADVPGTAVLAKVSGDAQAGAALSTLPQPLVVQLRTAFGVPIPGATITWSTGQDGVLNPAISVTGADGRASTQWTLGAQQANQAVTATAGNATVTFTGTATYPLRIAVQTPRPGETVLADSLPVLVGITSQWALRSATATVDGRTISLSYAAGAVHGTLSLAGLAMGAKSLRVLVRDLAGDSAVAVVPFTYTHSPSQPSVTLPITDMTANPDIPLAATCGDCSTLEAKVNGTTIAAGTTSIGASASLAAFADPAGDPRTVYVDFVATSASGQSVHQSVGVYVFNNPEVERVAYGGVRMLDVRTTRALYATGPDAQHQAHLFIRDLGTSVETEIAALPPFADVQEGFLEPGGGAIWSARLTPSTGRVYEWRGASVADLGAATPAVGMLKVQGRWGGWSSGSMAVVRDLQSGTNELVVTDLYTASSAGAQFDVASNGDLVYTHAGRQVTRVRLGVSTLLTTDPAYAVDLPKTDGTNVVFSRFTLGCGTEPCTATVRLGPDGTEVLSQQNGIDQYAVNNGWVAFRQLVGGVRQVFTRSPGGTVQQRSNLGSDVSIESLGPDGEVVMLSSGRRYLNRAGTGTPVKLVTAATGRFSTSFWRGTTGYVVVENTVLRILP